MIQKGKPALLAMVICDQIIREEGTKKLSLVGLFNRIQAKKFPCVHSKLHVYLAITDYIGETNCELIFSDSDGREIVKLAGPIKFPDRLSVIEMNFGMNNIPLPQSGMYHFDFKINGILLGHRKFKVDQSED